jgi:hypothetical protein
MNIGWTTISTAKHSPIAGSQAIQTLRDLLSVWSAENEEDGSHDSEKLPVVYHDDLLSKLLRALESLAVVATESRQHQSFALVLLALAMMFERLQPSQRAQAEDMIPRILSRVQDEVFTTELDEALSSLADALDAAGRRESAEVVREARQRTKSTVPSLAGTDGSVSDLVAGNRSDEYKLKNTSKHIDN